jgi:cytochrome c oxidase assembly protein Cox11
VTGFGGTPMRAAEADARLAPTGKLISVRFDANTNSALPGISNRKSISSGSPSARATWLSTPPEI